MNPIQAFYQTELHLNIMVRITGLEPARYFYHQHLKLACLPIPPYPHIKMSTAGSVTKFVRRLREVVTVRTCFCFLPSRVDNWHHGNYLRQRVATRIGNTPLAIRYRAHNRRDWCLVPESNQRHGDFQSPALPAELTRHITFDGLIIT